MHLMHAMRGGLAVGLTGTELSQFRRVDLGQKFYSSRVGPGEKLAFEEAAIFFLGLFA
jgi:hypothetical protein